MPEPGREELVARLRAAGCVYAEDEADLLREAATDSEELHRLAERRIAGEPLEPLLGWVEFAGRRLLLGPGVFVPRRRTELLARSAAELCVDGEPALDLCCGIGAVAAVVAALRPAVEVWAADLDPVAVAWARRNLAPDRVVVGDLFQSLPEALRGRFAVVAVNAPYVPTSATAYMPAEARIYEPLVALDGGPDGTGVHERVIAAARPWLSPGGALLIETGRRQSALTAAIMERHGFTAAITVDDELDATVVMGS